MKIKFFYWIRKIWNVGFFPLFFCGLLVAGSISKLTTQNQAVFYNFEAYLDPQNKTTFQTKYRYNVFQNITEFDALMQNSKAVGGITSDFQAVSFINKGLIKPINYSKIYGEDFPQDSISKQEEYLQSIWRPQVWNHFKSFDKYLNGKKYWQYAMPYYIQDKVIAYNVDKISRSHLSELTIEEQEQGIDFGENPTFESVIKTLMKKKYKKIGWTDAIGDNILHGSYFKNLKDNSQNTDLAKLSLEITPENLESNVKGFIDLVETSSGSSLFDNSKNVLVSDGLELVTRLIDPKGDLDVAVLYNGDAIDAYYFEDNFPELSSREQIYFPIKFVRPIDNLVMVDVLVIASDLNTKESDELLEHLYESVFKGIRMTTEELENFSKNLQENENLETIQETFSHPDTLPYIRNFDYINYTPTHKSTYQFFLNNYFSSEEEVDVVAQNMFQAADIKNTKHFFSFIQPLDAKLTSLLNVAYFLKTHK